MKNYHDDLHQKIEELPPDLRHEAEDFIHFLAERKRDSSRVSARRKWLDSIKRGPSTGTTASATVEKMREEERC